MQLRQDDASLPNDIEAIEQQMAEVRASQKACQDAIEDLLKREDPTQGIFFAAEIHEAKKNRMLLQYQYDLRVAKKNRLLRFGDEYL